MCAQIGKQQKRLYYSGNLLKYTPDTLLIGTLK